MINKILLIKSLLVTAIVFSAPAFSAETLYLPLDIHGKPGESDSGLAVSATALVADPFTITHKEKGVFDIQGLATDSVPAKLQSILTVLKKTSIRSSEEIRASDDLFAVGDGTVARIAQGGRAGFQMPVGSVVKVNGLFKVNQHLIMPIYFEYQNLKQHRQITFYCEDQVCRFSDFGNWQVAKVALVKGAIGAISRALPFSVTLDVAALKDREIIVPATNASDVHVYLEVEQHDILIMSGDSIEADKYRPISKFFHQGKESAVDTDGDFAEFLAKAFKHEAAPDLGYSVYWLSNDGELVREVVFLDGLLSLLSNYNKVKILGSTPVTGGELVWCLLEMPQGKRILMVLPVFKTNIGLEMNLLAVTTTYLLVNRELIFAAVWEYLLQEPVTFVDGEVPFAEKPTKSRTNTL